MIDIREGVPPIVRGYAYDYEVVAPVGTAPFPQGAVLRGELRDFPGARALAGTITTADGSIERIDDRRLRIRFTGEQTAKLSNTVAATDFVRAQVTPEQHLGVRVTFPVARPVTVPGSVFVPSPVTITPARIVSTAQVRAPVVTRPAQFIAPARIASTSAVRQPSVAPGGVTISVGRIASTAVVRNPAIALAGVTTIVPSRIASTAAVRSPTLVPGAVNVAPSRIAPTSVVRSPALTTGSGSIVVSRVGPTSVVRAPVVTLSYGIAPTRIASAAVVRAPTVAPGPVSIVPSRIASTAVVRAPTVVASNPWLYARQVNVPSAGAAKTDFPVRVDLTSANFDFSHARTNGEDVRFLSGSTPVPYWIEAWDASGQTATLWAKAPSVPASGGATLKLLYGNSAAAKASSITDTFVFGDDFTNLDRLIGPPDKSYVNRGSAYGVVLGNRVANIVTASGVAGSWNQTVREQANVVYDPTDSDSTRRYKFYYTGQDISSGGASAGPRRIGVSFSADGLTWTDYASNPVIGNGTSARGEDPYIVRNIDGTLYRDGSGYMHMFCEDQAQADMLHYYSLDGVSWTADANNPVIARGAAGSYDDQIVASPIVVHLGGNNKFLMLYEARTSAYASGNALYETVCVARSTSLTGKVWTKDATNNPIYAADVPDDLIFTGTQWVLLTHQTSGVMQRAATSVTNTDNWTNTSFTDGTPSAMFGTGGVSYNAMPDAATKFGRRVSVGMPSGNIDQFDVLGSDVWAFERVGGGAKSPATSVINVRGDGALVLDPTLDNAATAATYFAYTRQLALTSNFMVMMRRRVEVTTDDQRAQITIGAGTPTPLSGNETISYQPDGYSFMSFNPGAGSDFQIRKYVGSAVTTLATSTVTAAESQAFGRHEISYLSTGALRYAINGTQKATATDTAHLALSKQIVLSQGTSSANPGGKQTVSWIAVRPYDGSDPTTTVGAETSA